MRSWLELLPGKHYREVEEHADLLACWPAGLPACWGTGTPMPFARPLRDGVFELRPTLGAHDTRITYGFTPERRIVLLTVFHKTRMREAAQVARAVAARKVRDSERGPAHETYSRGEEGDAS